MGGKGGCQRRLQAASISDILVGCSQPSIFSYLYLIVERADRIARELDASAKRET